MTRASWNDRDPNAAAPLRGGGAAALRSAIVAAALGVALVACSASPDAADPDENPSQKVAIAVAAAGGYSVEILANAPLQVGLNQLYVRVTTSAGAPVTDAVVHFRPLLSTRGAERRCPVLGPGPAGQDGLHRLRVVLDVASGSDSRWSAEVEVIGGAGTATIAFPSLAVAQGKNLARAFVSGETGYVMALEFLAPLRVGLNPVAVTLHATADQGMTFEPVSDATLLLDPQMPSMGHGSPGSVHPRPVAEGWYEGQLSFSMPGDWLTTVTAVRASAEVGSPEFFVFF